MAVLYILGSGNPTPTSDRFGSSYVLNLRDDYLMFDCGPASTYKLAKVGLSPIQINYLFFTHHHFDHNADYPCFLLCRWDQSLEQNHNLKVFGPPPTKLITEGLIGKQGIFSYDLIARINHPISKSVYVNRGGRLPREWPSINVEDIHPERIIENEYWKITSALAEHVEPYLVSLAYKIEANETSVVFTGDTKPCESIINISKDAKVLVANCTREKRDTGLDIKSSAKLAQESGVEKLILTHIGPKLAMPGSRVRVCKKIEEIYEGDIIFSDELMKITI